MKNLRSFFCLYIIQNVNYGYKLELKECNFNAFGNGEIWESNSSIRKIFPQNFT